jgi:hypothetical protein
MVNCKDLEGNGLTEVLSRHLGRVTEENHKNPQSRQSVSHPRHEPRPPKHEAGLQRQVLGHTFGRLLL